MSKVLLQTPGWNISIYIANHGKTHQGDWNSKNLIPVKLAENNEKFGNLVEDAVKDP